jgi:beta-N-acetylhexosaminidase
LAAGAKIALYALSSDPGEYYAGRTFAMEVQERSGSLSVFYADAFTGEEFFQRAIRTSRAADIRVVALFSRLADSKGSVGLKQRHIRLIKDFSRDPQPLVVISFNSPYFLRQFPEADTYFCTYRHADQNQVAAAKALFGEIEFKGRLPISIPGLFPAGHGVRPAGSRPDE